MQEVIIAGLTMICLYSATYAIAKYSAHKEKLRRETMGMIHLGAPKPNYRTPSQMNAFRPMILYGEPNIQPLDNHEPIEITTYGDKEKRYLKSPICWTGDIQPPSDQESYDCSESWKAVIERKPLTEWQKNRGAELNMTYDEYHTKEKEMRETLIKMKKELEASGICKEMTS